MPVFMCIGSNYDRMLVSARSKAAAKGFIQKNVSNFVCADCVRAPRQVLDYARQRGEPIVHVQAGKR